MGSRTGSPVAGPTSICSGSSTDRQSALGSRRGPGSGPGKGCRGVAGSVCAVRDRAGRHSPDEAARRVNESLIRDRLLEALDQWLTWSPSAELLAVLRATDPDPFRDAVRADSRLGNCVLVTGTGEPAGGVGATGAVRRRVRCASDICRESGARSCSLRHWVGSRATSAS